MAFELRAGGKSVLPTDLLG